MKITRSSLVTATLVYILMPSLLFAQEQSLVQAPIVSTTSTVAAETPAVSASAETQADTAPAPQANLAAGSDAEAAPGVPSAATTAPDYFTGALSGNYPIPVPEGRAGMKPVLSLDYHTGTGNGPFGVDWQLQPGSIERQSKNGIRYDADAYVYRTSGGAETLVKLADGTYATEVAVRFDQFEKRTAADGNWYFVVTDTRGTVREYGTSRESRLANPDDPKQIFSWRLARVIDTSGNTITYTWTQDQGNLYLRMIQYAGNAISFKTQTRPDLEVSYELGFKVTTALRVVKVIIEAANHVMPALELGYGNDPNEATGRSLLRSITVVDATGKKLPSTLYRYQDGALTTSSPVWTSGPQPIDTMDRNCLTADFTGDGAADIACHMGNGVWKMTISARDSWTTSTISGPAPVRAVTEQCALADLNHDGRTDVVCYAGTPAGQWQRVLGNATGWGDADVLQGSTVSGFPISNQCVLTDQNGDGASDLVCWKGGSKWEWTLSQGERWGATTTVTGPNAGNVAERCVFADFSADGKTDIACWTGEGGGWHRGISNGTSWDLEYRTGLVAGLPIGNRCRFADVNTDRRTDMLCMGGKTNEWVLGLATPTGWEATVSFTGPSTGVPIANNVLAMDATGDGKADLVNYDFTTKKWGVYAWNGTTFNKQSSLDGPLPTVALYKVCTAGDFNADGKADVACRQQNDAWQLLLSNGVTPDLMSGTTNTFGGTTSFEYSRAALMPSTQVPFPLDIVTRITTDDGSGKKAVTQIGYSGGYFDVGKRDYRGFHVARVTGPQSDGAGAIAVIRYHQGSSPEFNADDPQADGGYMRGRPDQVRILDATGAEVRKSQFFYAASTAIPRFNPVSEIVTTACERGVCGQQTRVRQQYDEYGNITHTDDFGDTSVGIADDTTRITTFAYNKAKHIVSLPASEEVLNGSTRMSYVQFFYDGTNSCGTASTSTTPTRGFVTRTLRWVGGGVADIEERTAFDDAGNIVCTADALGNQSTFTFDSSKQFLLSTKNALGHTTTYAYYGVGTTALDGGLYGLPRSITDPNGAVTLTEWDSFGRKSANGTPLGHRVTWTYADLGVPSRQSVREESGALAKTTYLDGLGRPVKTRVTATQQRFVVTEVRYDERGLAVGTTLPHFEGTASIGESTTTFDALRRPSEERDAAGARQTTCYGSGFVDVIDPNGHRTRQAFSANGLLLHVDRFDGVSSRDCSALANDTTTPYSVTRYTYDPLQRLTQITDALGVVTSIAWDGVGRRTRLVDPAIGERRFSYNAAGDETGWQSAASGSAMFVQYDALHRPVQKDYFSKKPLGAGDVMSSYDAPGVNGIGRLTGTKTATGVTQALRYDLEGRVLSIDHVVDGKTYLEGRTYDANGRLSEVFYPDGKRVTYAYDGPELSLVRRGATVYASFSNYNAAGQPQQVQFGNGSRSTLAYETPSNADCPKATYRLCNTRTLAADGSVALDISYVYDAKGNIANTREPGATRSFIYDSFDRLRGVAVSQSAVVASDSYKAGVLSADMPRDWAKMSGSSSLIALEEGFTYNSTDDLTWKWDVGTYVYPAISSAVMNPHAPRRIGNDDVTLDRDGNVVASGDKTFAYSLDGKLVAADAPLDPVRRRAIGGGGGPAHSVTFDYDSDDSRVREVSATGVTTYIGSLAECRPSTGCVDHIFAGSARIGSESSDGKMAYYHGDAQRSARVTTDASGKVSSRLAYSSYGAPKGGGTLPTFLPTTFLFGNQPYSPVAGVYVFGSRAYDPAIGRFLSPDSIVPMPGSPQYLNRYSYCLGNPISLVDPSGHWAFLAWIVAGALLGAANAALHHQNILKGALIGAVTAGFMQATPYLVAAGVNHYVASLVTGSLSGAVTSAIGGGDIPSGMLAGGLFFASDELYSTTFPPFTIGGRSAQTQLESIATQLANATVHGAAEGAAFAAVTGGDVMKGALRGAEDWALGEAGNMAFGHVAGFLGSGGHLPTFDKEAGQYVYTAPIYSHLSDGAITFSNVTIDAHIPTAKDPRTGWQRWDRHEVNHTHEQSPVLGPAYIPAHVLSLGIGQVSGVFPGHVWDGAHHRYGPLENIGIYYKDY